MNKSKLNLNGKTVQITCHSNGSTSVNEFSIDFVWVCCLLDEHKIRRKTLQDCSAALTGYCMVRLTKLCLMIS